MLILVAAIGKFGKWRDVVATCSSWSFSSSWLTNVTALGAVLVEVPGATGFLADVLPGTDTGRFTGLRCVLFGGVRHRRTHRLFGRKQMGVRFLLGKEVPSRTPMLAPTPWSLWAGCGE